MVQLENIFENNLNRDIDTLYIYKYYVKLFIFIRIFKEKNYYHQDFPLKKILHRSSFSWSKPTMVISNKLYKVFMDKDSRSEVGQIIIKQWHLGCYALK